MSERWRGWVALLSGRGATEETDYHQRDPGQGTCSSPRGTVDHHHQRIHLDRFCEDQTSVRREVVMKLGYKKYARHR